MYVIRDIRAGGAAEFVSRPLYDYSLRGLVIGNGKGRRLWFGRLAQSPTLNFIIATVVSESHLGMNVRRILYHICYFNFGEIQ